MYPRRLAQVPKAEPLYRQAVKRGADYNYSPARYIPSLALLSGIGALSTLGLGEAANMINTAINGEEATPIVDSGIAALVGAAALPAVSAASMRAAKYRRINDAIDAMGDVIVADEAQAAQILDSLQKAINRESGETASQLLFESQEGRAITPFMAVLEANRMFDYGA
ncbi:hypothetical protein [Synechococcus elongatus]|uniref:hypothetical protein n=1 Tax=Synechococcus elongatus TaxID=32046 RepID=UPI000F7DAEB0|nr:hypothetical protein [Synechococcus elongatus]